MSSAAIGRRPPKQHRPGIEPGLHLHDGDAGFGIAGQDRALDRRRAAPARQQRGVDVDAAEARHVEHRLRQDQAVGGDHHDVGADRAHALLRGRIASGSAAGTPRCRRPAPAP